MELKKHEQLLTVVIPVYNEAEDLPTFAPTAIEFCGTRGWKIIFVNDGSWDDTKQILDALNPSPHVQVVHHKVNRGYGGWHAYAKISRVRQYSQSGRSTLPDYWGAPSRQCFASRNSQRVSGKNVSVHPGWAIKHGWLGTHS